MIDYSLIFNYGILGLWTASLLYDRHVTLRRLKEIIKDNTRALELIEVKLR